jgi:2-dehydro-3-deoxygluconokinase
VSFDVNHRAGVWGTRDPVPVYAELAHAAAVVFAGEDEARLLTGSAASDPVDLVGALTATTGGDVVLKLGAAGCLAHLGGERWQVPAVPVTVVDTVGAGDAFVAGYVAELLRGLPPADRLATAVRSGALVCAAPGDWEGLPTRADLALLTTGDQITR